MAGFLLLTGTSKTRLQLRHSHNLYLTLNDQPWQTLSLLDGTFPFEAGEIIVVGIYKRGNNSDQVEDLDYFVTIVWEYDAWG